MLLRMNLLFMGPPGAGKGTQANFISQKYNIPQISTGDILRAAVQNKTPMGLQAQQFMDAGQLVPDEVVIGIVRDRLQEADTKPGYILDGFPRTVAQADALKAILADMEQELDLALNLRVSQDELVMRLLDRAQKQGRADDTADVIQQRLTNYNEQTLPLLEYYKKENILRELDGVGDVEIISRRLQNILENI